MTDLIETDESIPALTLKEARAADAIIRSNAGTFAVQLYLFRAQKGYMVLGYKAIADYCKERLNLPEQTLYDWMDRVEATLKVKGITTRKLVDRLVDKKYDGRSFDLELLPTRTSKEINRLPGIAEAKTVWEEYSSTRDLATGSEKANIGELKRIVARYLNDPYDETGAGNGVASRPSSAAPLADKPPVIQRPVEAWKPKNPPSTSTRSVPTSNDIEAKADAREEEDIENERCAMESIRQNPYDLEHEDLSAVMDTLCLTADSVVFLPDEALYVIRAQMPNGDPVSVFVAEFLFLEANR